MSLRRQSTLRQNFVLYRVDFRYGSARLAYEVDRAQRQCPNRFVGALLRRGTYHDDRQRTLLHDCCQCVEPVHYRHDNIKRQHVGLKFFYLVNGVLTVHCCADNLEVALTLEKIREDFSHKSRVISNQNTNHLGRLPLAGNFTLKVFALNRFKAINSYYSPDLLKFLHLGKKISRPKTSSGLLQASETLARPLFVN